MASVSLSGNFEAAPRRVHFAGLTVGFLLLVLYGSFVPFDYRWLPWDEALDRFRALPYFRLGLISRSDLIANFLLYIPLSFLAMASLSTDRARRMDLWAGLLIVPLMALLSVAIEFVQLYFAGRTTSLNDIYAESIGGATGALLWVASGRRMVDWLRNLRKATGERGLAAQLLPAYLLGLVAVHAMPMDLTISPREVYQKYREGRIMLLPFASFSGSTSEVVRNLLWSLASFAPVGGLTALLRGPVWQGKRGWLWALGLGLATAAVVEVLHLIVYTRVFDLGDFVINGVAVLMGWLGVRAYRQLRASSSRNVLWGEVLGAARRSPQHRALRVAAVVAWLVAAVVLSWEPFNFSASPEMIAHKLDEMSLIPFADYYWQSEFEAFSLFLSKALFFAILGILLTPGRERADLANAVLVILAAMVVETGLEVGQLFLPGHYASVTDVVVGGIGAGFGFAAMSWVQPALGTVAAFERRRREPCR